jgi:hypothetical protein
MHKTALGIFFRERLPVELQPRLRPHLHHISELIFLKKEYR